jgi:ankyrin repeat protein
LRKTRRLSALGFGLWPALGALAVASVSLSGAGGTSKLSAAIQSGDRATALALLKQRAEVAAVDADGTTPLHWAVRADDLDLSTRLVQAGANVKAINRYGVSPLSLAATNGHARMTAMLLRGGALANQVVWRGQTVLMTAARTGNPDVVQALIDGGADVNSQETQLGETALMWAASENHAAVVTLLLARGAEIEARSNPLTFPKDRFGLEGVLTILPRGHWTALMYAARDGAPDATRTLLDAGADINAVDPDGTTPLVRAIWNSHYDTAKVLLERGADPNLADTADMAALYAAVDMSSLGEVYGMPPRKVKDAATALDIIKLVIAKGGKVDAKLKSAALQRNHTPGEPQLGAGTTPLMRAARNGDSAAMRVLLAAGADASLAQPNGTTVLMLASGVGRGLGVFAKDYGTEADLLEGVKTLLAQKVNVNAANNNGLTALHYAAQGGLNTVVAELAKAGATLDAKDKNGRTPVDVALGVGGRGRAGGPPPVHTSTAELIKGLMAGRQVGR